MQIARSGFGQVYIGGAMNQTKIIHNGTNFYAPHRQGQLNWGK